MSTSTSGKQQQVGGGGGGGGEHGSIQAPPPTPSNHQLHPESISTTTELSLILNQLLKTPTLSLPLPSRRLRPLKPTLSPPPPPPPCISLLNPNQQTKQTLLSAASHHGFFHLTDLIHIPSHLPPSSLHEAKSLLFSHTHHFPTNLSSLGFHQEEEDEDDDEDEPLLVLEPTSIDPNTLPALKEFTECLHRVAMDVLQMLFDMDPETIITQTPRCLIWISTTSTEEDHEELEMEWRRRSKCYPYVMCMQYYEITRGRARPSWIIGDSGELVSISPRADSLLVTLGDIAQVWSNGRFKKVRSIPFHGCNINGDESSISVSFMVTLPMESTISPLPPPLTTIKDANINGDEDDDDDGWKRFSPFLMEEYAWKVYHERFTVKDPLISYRIQIS